MRMILVALCLLALGRASAAAAAECVVEDGFFIFGSDFTKHMVARSGIPCTHGFNIRGGAISAMIVSEPAQHGTAAVAGKHKWGYKSASGYVGPDRFTIQITGEVMGRRVISGQSTIIVDVDVQR